MGTQGNFPVLRMNRYARGSQYNEAAIKRLHRERKLETTMDEYKKQRDTKSEQKENGLLKWRK
jgi:hypothetical protein